MLNVQTVVHICDRCHERIEGDVFIQGGAVLCRQCATPRLEMPEAVRNAKLKLATATNRALRADEAIGIAMLLGQLDTELRGLKAAVARLAKARAYGNQVDLWRAIGELESYAIREVQEQ